MDHHFNIEVAEKYGVGEAILLHNICFWQKKNIANNVNYHDGRYWVYNSVQAYSELFPYYTDRQIRNILKKLEEKGCLHVGRYNKMKIDRTKWYSASDEIMLIHGIKPNDSNCQMQLHEKVNAITQKGKCNDTNKSMDVPKMSNGCAQNVKPIPYINTDKRKDNNNNIYSAYCFFSSTDFTECYKDFVNMRKKIKKPMTERAEKIILNKLTKMCGEDTKQAIEILERSILKNWQDVFELPKDNTRFNNTGAKPNTPIDYKMQQHMEHDKNIRSKFNSGKRNFTY